MARPKRTGLHYFSLDCDCLKDDKMQFLLQQHGPGGVLVVLALWARMYASEGPIKVNQPLLFGASREAGVPVDAVQSIINAAVECELLLIDQATSELWSKGVEKRIVEITKDRNRKRKERGESCSDGQTPDKLRTNTDELGKTSDTLSLSLSLSLLDLFLEGESEGETANLTDRITMTRDQLRELVAAFGKEAICFYVPFLHNHLLSTGQLKAEAAPWIANWITKDRTEGRNFFSSQRGSKGPQKWDHYLEEVRS